MPGVPSDTDVLDRRAWLKLLGMGTLGWVATRAIACVGKPSSEAADSELDPLAVRLTDASMSDGEASDAGATVILYDTFAQALYLDGTLGPKTGTIRAADMAAGADKLYDFWHGHGGQLHKFTLTAANFADLRKKKRVTVTTTIVEDHQHKLFVDPVDLRWRVPGALPVEMPV